VRNHTVFIGLGSNLGDRAGMLNRATAAIKGLPGLQSIAGSSIYETDPYGKAGQSRFLNAVIEVETPSSPPELLHALKEIEILLGRQAGERWGPREIDLDILLYDGLVFQDTEVTVPHPDLEHRRFVLIPFREISPDTVHPVSGLTIEEVAAACPREGEVRKTSYRLDW